MPAAIHDRAMRLVPEMKKTYGPKKAKQVAFAVATQQAHAKGEAPKKWHGKPFGTAAGKREAKAKFDRPKSEYRSLKEAMLAKQALSSDEVMNWMREYPEVTGIAAGALGGGGIGLLTALKKKRRDKVRRALLGAGLGAGAGGLAGYMYRRGRARTGEELQEGLTNLIETVERAGRGGGGGGGGLPGFAPVPLFGTRFEGNPFGGKKRASLEKQAQQQPTGTTESHYPGYETTSLPSSSSLFPRTRHSLLTAGQFARKQAEANYERRTRTSISGELIKRANYEYQGRMMMKTGQQRRLVPYIGGGDLPPGAIAQRAAWDAITTGLLSGTGTHLLTSNPEYALKATMVGAGMGGVSSLAEDLIDKYRVRRARRLGRPMPEPSPFWRMVAVPAVLSGLTTGGLTHALTHGQDPNLAAKVGLGSAAFAAGIGGLGMWAYNHMKKVQEREERRRRRIGLATTLTRHPKFASLKYAQEEAESVTPDLVAPPVMSEAAGVAQAPTPLEQAPDPRSLASLVGVLDPRIASQIAMNLLTSAATQATPPATPPTSNPAGFRANV